MAAASDLLNASDELAALRESEARLRSIFDNTEDFILGTDLESRITSVNPALERLIGLPLDEIIGRPFADFVAPEWRAQAADAARAKLSGRAHRTVYDLELLAGDGRAVPVEVSSWIAYEHGVPVGIQGIGRDISDRRAAEARFRELVESLPLVTYVKVPVASGALATVFMSPQIEELLGFGPEDWRGDGWWAARIHDEDRARVMEHSDAAASRGERFEAEYRMVAADGRVVWVHDVQVPRLDRAGRLVETQGFLLDVSARREAEDLARESGEIFRAAFEDAATGMIVVAPDGSILHANAAMCAMLDFSSDEMRKLSVIDITHPDDRAASRDLVARLGDGTVRNETLEKRYQRKDGEPVWVRRSASSVLDSQGNVRFIIGIAVDITARRASVERFRMLFEHNPQGIDIVDRHGRLVQANPALARMLGYDDVDELVGLTLEETTHPDDIYLALFEELMRGRRTHFELEKRALRKDGGYVTVHLTAFALPDESGTPQYAIGVLDDVTERRSLEEQLRQSQRMEAIGQLAGGVAHDFNNLLTAITSYCDLAAAAEGPLRASVDGIRGAADRAAELTQQLLAFSRRQVLEMTVLDVNAVVSQQIPMLDRLLGEDVQTVLSLSPDVASVKMDAGRLTQVLMNLAVNARDAMSDGGLLTIETRNVELQDAPTTSGRLSGPHVLLAVSDTGCGMDEATIAHAFEPFFTTKEPGRGTGLGLPTVLGIVEQSGGRVSVYSEPGVGTTFKVYMPCADIPACVTEAPISASTNEWPHGHERILLVEDNEAVRRPLAQVLGELGYDVVVAAGPEDAVAVADDVEIDLLVTDVVMPSMNGRQLAESLRPRRPEMHVLYISGYTDDAVIARGLVEPGTAFLQKPFGADKLAEKLRELLDA
jgi:two-component system, cell cycle sensor histidine kinase and response regulator CckA